MISIKNLMERDLQELFEASLVGDSSRRVPVSAAIGTALWPPGDSLRTLLDRADAAMYRENADERR
jgi:GGDEF domain-containing protein